MGPTAFSPKKGRLICFTGIDGAGKTTHAMFLINHLKNQTLKCSYVRAASRPIFAYIFFAITWLLGFWKDVRKDAFTDPLELAPESIRDKVGIVWRCLLFLDFQIKTLMVRLPLWLGRTVICDRYVYDLIMELILANLYSDSFCRLIAQTTPKPHMTFLMDAPEEVAHARRESMPMSYLSARRKIYLRLSRIFGFVVVDSRNDFAHNRKRILDEIARVTSKDAFQDSRSYGKAEYIKVSRVPGKEMS